jgi:hypothetical protein
LCEPIGLSSHAQNAIALTLLLLRKTGYQKAIQASLLLLAETTIADM